jgi:hypothetical protein
LVRLPAKTPASRAGLSIAATLQLPAAPVLSPSLRIPRALHLLTSLLTGTWLDAVANRGAM